MRIVALLVLFITVMTMSVSAQNHVELPLWPDGAPNDNGLSGPEKGVEQNRIENVSKPALMVYLPKESNGQAVIACPGGGYAFLSIANEGFLFAPWFNEQGIALIVLKYRLPNGHREVPLSDAEQAIKIVRQHAAEWKIDVNKVGIMGSSAGGHLASTLATHFTRDTRPDFQILLYPVITLDPSYAHMGSRRNLLGADTANAEMVKKFSNEFQVSPQTPTAFIMLSDDDKTVPPANSVNYYLALRKNGVSSELHIYPTGGHGWGSKDSFSYKPQWTTSLKKWLEVQNQQGKQ
jgi:acetyl esterase/lipase